MLQKYNDYSNKEEPTLSIENKSSSYLPIKNKKPKKDKNSLVEPAISVDNKTYSYLAIKNKKP